MRKLSKLSAGAFLFLAPFFYGCSSIIGGGLSSDPAVAAQQQQIEVLENELKEAERMADEAEERYRAAKSRLKAAEHELKALKLQAKHR